METYKWFFLKYNVDSVNLHYHWSEAFRYKSQLFGMHFWSCKQLRWRFGQWVDGEAVRVDESGRRWRGRRTDSCIMEESRSINIPSLLGFAISQWWTRLPFLLRGPSTSIATLCFPLPTINPQNNTVYMGPESHKILMFVCLQKDVRQCCDVTKSEYTHCSDWHTMVGQMDGGRQEGAIKILYNFQKS